MLNCLTGKGQKRRIEEQKAKINFQRIRCSIKEERKKGPNFTIFNYSFCPFLSVQLRKSNFFMETSSLHFKHSNFPQLPCMRHHHYTFSHVLFKKESSQKVKFIKLYPLTFSNGHLLLRDNPRWNTRL